MAGFARTESRAREVVIGQIDAALRAGEEPITEA